MQSQLMSRTKSKAKGAETDLILDVAHQIETIDTQAKPGDFAISSLLEASNDVHRNYFMIGGLLKTITEEKYFVERGFETFDDFCEELLGYRRRKAYYLIEIYDKVLETELVWDDIKDLGWSKLLAVLSILTKENARDVLAQIAEMTHKEIQEFVQRYKGELPDSEDKEVEPKRGRMSIPVWDHQKEAIEEALGEAKDGLNTDDTGTALEGICHNFLASERPLEQPSPVVSLREVMETAGCRACVEMIVALWPKVGFSADVKGPEEFPS